MTTKVASKILVASLIVGASASVERAARAAEPGPDALPMHVVTVATPDADQQADSLTKALRSAVRSSQGWSLAEGDYALEVLTLQLKCTDPPDASCQSRISDQIKSERFLWGQIKKKGPTVVGALHLWVRGKGTTDFPLDYSANLVESNDDALKKIANEALKALTGGPPKGSLHVKSSGVAGQVFLDGEPLGAISTGDATFVVPSGPHRVVVRASGYADAEAPVVVRPNTSADVSLSPSKVEPSKPLDWRLYGGVGGLGLGAIFGTIGLVGSIKVQSARTNADIGAYKKGKQGQNYCDAAAQERNSPLSPDAALAGRVDDACKSASSGETLQALFYPLAGIVGGVGIYLLATSGTKGKPAASSQVRIEPYVGPRSGKVDVTLDF